MQMQAFNQVALLVPTTVAYTSVGSCSWLTTSTIAATAATYTSAPCPTVTGSFMVAKDMEGAFELHGIEEIQGDLVINGAKKLDRIDLGDLQKVGGLHISNIRVDGDGMSWPKLHMAKRIYWSHLQLFDGSGGNNPKITGVENLNLYNTTIADLSDVFDIEAGGYIYVAGNANMDNVTLPNLNSVGVALEVFDNAPSATISFPKLEAAESIVVSQIGRGAGGAEATTSPSSSLDLPKLVEVNKDFTIGDSPGLAAVNAPALTRVHGDLKVVNNSRLRTMPFESLSSVDGDLVYNGSFDALSGQVEHTIGAVRYETDRGFSCRRYYGSTYSYQGDYSCTSASGSYDTVRIITALNPWNTPTPTPTPTPRPARSHPRNKRDRLEWWDVLILCLLAAAFVAATVGFELRRQRKTEATLAAEARRENRVNLATANNAGTPLPTPPSPPPVYRPRESGDEVVVFDGDADEIMPPSAAAMAPPPKYSEVVDRDAEKEALEREDRGGN